VADLISIAGGKKPGAKPDTGPAKFETSPEVAAELRAALEQMIAAGIVGGFVSGEAPDGALAYTPVPGMWGFAMGHARNLMLELERAYDGE
jgi:hypothetical protein